MRIRVAVETSSEGSGASTVVNIKDSDLATMNEEEKKDYVESIAVLAILDMITWDYQILEDSDGKPEGHAADQGEASGERGAGEPAASSGAEGGADDPGHSAPGDTAPGPRSSLYYGYDPGSFIDGLLGFPSGRRDIP